MNAFFKFFAILSLLLLNRIQASEVSYRFSFEKAECWDTQQEKWVPTPKKQQFEVTMKQRTQKKSKKSKSKGKCRFVNQDLFVNNADIPTGGVIPTGEVILFNAKVRKRDGKGMLLSLWYAGDDMEGFADMEISIRFTDKKGTEGVAEIEICYYGDPRYRNVTVQVTRS